MLFTEEWALGLEGIKSRKQLLQGRAGGGAGWQTDRQTDRQMVPSSSCCLHPPLTIPRKSCSWFCLQPLHWVSGLSCLQSLGGGGGGEWAEPQTSTDGSRYKAPDTRQKQIQGAVNPEGCMHSNQPCHYQEGTQETALPRGAGWETPNSNTRLHRGPILLTGANVFCKLFCISTGLSFCMQANSIHWKTTTTTSFISLHGY